MQRLSEDSREIGICPIWVREQEFFTCALCPSEDAIAFRLSEAFNCGPTLAETLLTLQDFEPVVRACGLGYFWRKPLFDFAQDCNPLNTRGQESENTDDTRSVKSTTFISRWLTLKRSYENGRTVHQCVDSVWLFVNVVGKCVKDRLSADDLIPWVEDVADCYLDLTDSYLREPYVDTVLARILLRYGVHLTGILTVSSLKVSGFGHLLENLCKFTGLVPKFRLSAEINVSASCDEEPDLPDVFSYDDFLAIFGVYWELTTKRRSLDCIRRSDLCDYAPLSQAFLCEVFKVASVRPFSVSENELSYPDFVWLIVSAEGKGSWPQSTEYLFRVLDLQSDGVLTPDELHYFYSDYLHQCNRYSRSFQDVMCELVDAVRPNDPSRFTLLDIRRSGLAHVFFAPFVDSPDSHHHRVCGVHRRKSSHASWWPSESFTDPGYWECFVQGRLDHMRESKHLHGTTPKVGRTSRYRVAKRHSRSRYRKSRNKSL